MFFSGFCLSGESELFDTYRIDNEVTVGAFSYGVQLLIENIVNGTYQREQYKKRIDKIQLFSPSYFNDKDIKYKRMQLMYFKKDSQAYCDNFLRNCGFDDKIKDKYFVEGTMEQLEDLLYYQWDEEKLQQIVDMGITIEVFLGSEDKIINSEKALEFFRKFGEVYFIKEKGHIL